MREHPEGRRQNGPGRGWAVRLAAIVGIAALAAGVVTLTDGAAGTSAQGVHQRARAGGAPAGDAQLERRAIPEALGRYLAFLNRKLDHLIEDERKGDGLGFTQLLPRIKEITEIKQDMVDEFFATEVYGVKFSVVFKKLDCVDSLLNRGLGESFPGSAATTRKSPMSNSRGPRSARSSWRSKLRGPSVPRGLLRYLAFLNRKLDHLIEDERKGDGLGFTQLLPRIKEITEIKQDMVDEFFATEVYGVKFSVVFKKLDCVDSLLNRGLGESFPGSDRDNEKIADVEFKRAKKCKEQLEEKLRAAPPPTQLRFGFVNPGWDHTRGFFLPGPPPTEYPSSVCTDGRVEPNPQGVTATAEVTPAAGQSPKQVPINADGTVYVKFGINSGGEKMIKVTLQRGTDTSVDQTTITVPAPPSNPSKSRDCP